MFQDFKIERIRDFDEALCEEINSHIEHCTSDMHNRAGVDKERKVTIELTFKPVSEQGHLIDAHVRGTVKSSIPPAKSKVHVLAADRRRPKALVYQSMDPDNPRQRSLDEIEEEMAKRENGVVPIRKASGD